MTRRSWHAWAATPADEGDEGRAPLCAMTVAHREAAALKVSALERVAALEHR